MADVLTDSQIGEIMAAFNAVDADNDGIIGANQLGMVLKTKSGGGLLRRG